MKFQNTARLIKDLYLGLNATHDRTVVGILEDLGNQETLGFSAELLEAHFRNIGLKEGPIQIAFDEESDDTLEIELRVTLNGSKEEIYMVVVERVESDGNFAAMYLNEVSLQGKDNAHVRLYFEEGEIMLSANEVFMEANSPWTQIALSTIVNIQRADYMGSAVRNDLDLFIAGLKRAL